MLPNGAVGLERRERGNEENSRCRSLSLPLGPTLLIIMEGMIDAFGFGTYAQRVLVHQRLVFWNSIHQEVASDSFCFLINYSWLLVFILYVFSLFFSGFNLYWWKGKWVTRE